MTIIKKLILGILGFGVLSTYANLHSYPGPNCLNTALVHAQILKYPRYTSNQEMYLYLKSSLCQEITLNEKRQKNDIQIILDQRPLAQKGIISHAYIYLTPEVMFEKIGFAVEAGYRYMKEDEIHAEYEVDFQLITVKSFRCQKLANKELAMIESLEKELFSLDKSFNGDKFLIKLNSALFKADTLTDVFIKNVIYQRTLSLIFQLGIIDGKYQSEGINQLVFGQANHYEIKKALNQML